MPTARRPEAAFSSDFGYSIGDLIIRARFRLVMSWESDYQLVVFSLRQ